MKEKIISILFVITIFAFSLVNLFAKDVEVSSSERRKLTTKESLKDDFTKNLEDYMKDQFVLRNVLISTNSIFDRYILNKIDTNDVYLKDGYIIEKNYPLIEKNVENFIKKVNFIKDTYLQNNKVFYAILPDKSYFLETGKHLKLNFESLYSRLKENINIEYIETVDLLNLESYYKTDIHIKQNSYLNIVKRIRENLKLPPSNENYKTDSYDNFHGSSYHKVPTFTESDKITILTDETIENSKVKHLEYGDKNVYELDRLEDVDSYNVYLGGPSALIEIDNDSAKTDRELIIFRDSFASSLTPLLIESYKKITLIDLRYIKMDLVKDHVDFDDKDVLFLYSTLIVNNSNLLKVDCN